MIQGYLSKLSVLPGQELSAHIGADRSSCHISVVRLLHGDPNPLGPGFLTEPQAWPGQQVVGTVMPETVMGSYLYLPNALPVDGPGSQPRYVGPAHFSWPGGASRLLVAQLRSGAASS